MSADPSVTSKLRDVLAEGVSDEASRRARRALLRSTLGSLGFLVAFVAFIRLVEGGRVSWHFPAAFAVLSVVMTAVRYRGLSPKPPEHPADTELAAMAHRYALCPSCGALLGRFAVGYGACGTIRRPWVVAAAVGLLVVGTVLLLVAVWVKSGRY